MSEANNQESRDLSVQSSIESSSSQAPLGRQKRVTLIGFTQSDFLNNNGENNAFNEVNLFCYQKVNS